MTSAYDNTVTTAVVTPWVQPDWCSTRWYEFGPSAVFSDISDPEWQSCQPSGFSNVWDTISPAVCPSGWTIAWEETGYVQTTVAYCCRDGFNVSTYIDNLGETGRSCESSFSETPFTALHLSDITATTDGEVPGSTVIINGTAWHRGWTVMWEQSDVPALSFWSAPQTTSASSKSSTGRYVTTSLTSGQGTPAPQSGNRTAVTASAGSTKLGTGAKAGIGVGITLFILVLAFLLVAFILRHRRRALAARIQPPDADADVDSHRPKELYGEEVGQRYEKDGNAVAEAEAGLSNLDAGPATRGRAESVVHEMQ